MLIRAGYAADLKLTGLRLDRLPVFPGGIAIMMAIMNELEIDRIVYSTGALRLGVLYDLLGRFHHHDMRDSTIAQFVRRYQVDTRQAARVERTALDLLGQLIDITLPEHEAEVRFLRWACSLHEIGISIAHNAYHKHGSYIVTYADMPGFSKKDQEQLALLLLGHRGKLEKVPVAPDGGPYWRLILCLRVAALLHRSRDDQPLPVIRLRILTTGGFQIELPTDWMQKNPLSAAALAEEALVWQRIGSLLRVKRLSVAAVADPAT